MNTLIYRENGNIEQKEFKSIYEAANWVKENTGYFEANENILIVDWKMKEQQWFQLQLTIKLVELE
jgi:hypothetical protein